MVDIETLQDALAQWQRGAHEPLSAALGFEHIGLTVPSSAFSDFGIDPAQPFTLEVAAQHHDFLVIRLVFPNRLESDVIRRAVLPLHKHNPARRAMLIIEARDDHRLVFASWGLGPGPFQLLKLWIDPTAPRRSELDILAGLAVGDASNASDLVLAQVRALDREEVTRRFFLEFRRHRAELAAAITGLPPSASQDRLDLALVLLSRLLFLYFIQRKSWLAGDSAYLRHLYESALRNGVPFFRQRLKRLFFGALNRPPRLRSKAALELGELPYLNGGLFERDALERKHPKLDVPDDCFATIFYDLLEKYQFTLREDQSADMDVAVDPEMLGRVFEGLMAGSQRGATGAFYTPRKLVDQLVDGALGAHLARAVDCDPALIESLLAGESPGLCPSLRQRLTRQVRSLRVLDPAVGSGAFLLKALQRLENLHDTLDGHPASALARFERRQQIIQRNLHGVDINGAAIRLCELRLWLALVVDLEVESIADVPPLPNVDIKIRQGDALVDPIDFLIQLGDLDHGALAIRWHKQMGKLSARRDRYFRAAGRNKRRAQQSMWRAEHKLAASFLAELEQQIDARRRELRLAAGSPNLFGKRSGLTRAQKRNAIALRRRKIEISRLLRRLHDVDELPFFSFPVHFADVSSPTTNFHIVLGNPPWVRPHHWSRLSRSRLSSRFDSLRNAGWKFGVRLAGAGRGFGAQLDLSALFLERSLELMTEDGALGFLLPAKLMRNLSAGALRRQVMSTTRVLRIEDSALATDQLFEATTYPLSLLLSQGKPGPGHATSVRVHDRWGDRLDFQLPQIRLPLMADDVESPWTLAPPEIRDVIDSMRSDSSAMGEQQGGRPCRGVFTGSNAVFLGQVTRANHSGWVGLRTAEAEIDIEAHLLRPALRGEDIAPWRFTVSQAIIWTHDNTGRPLPSLPTAAASHIRKHERTLKARVDLRPGQPVWTIFRARPDKWTRRVVWRDIAPAPSAVVVPSAIPFLNSESAVISLNTVYQIAAASDEDAHFLAAVLNSTVARAYLKAIAERASGGYFRFLGWTVALLPFPGRSDAAARAMCIELSRIAHGAGCLSQKANQKLDEAVAALYGLSTSQLEALQSFDARLSKPENRK